MKSRTSTNRLIGSWAILLCLVIAWPASGSLLVGVLTKDGIVLAADSRLNRLTKAGDHQIISDNEIKLISIKSRFLVGNCGKRAIGNDKVWRTVEEMGRKTSSRTSVEGFAEKLAKTLSKAYRSEYGEEVKKPSIILMVAGYHDGVGQLVEVQAPAQKTRVLHTTEKPGMAWCGDGGDIIQRLILGVDKHVADDERWDEEDKKALRAREYVFTFSEILIEDAIRLATLAARTAIEWSEFIKGDQKEPEHFHPTVGGPIDVAVVTPEGTKWIERKSVIGLKYK